jgi:hypothetical protein
MQRKLKKRQRKQREEIRRRGPEFAAIFTELFSPDRQAFLQAADDHRHHRICGFVQSVA